MRIPMHKTDLQLHHPKTSRCLARQQSTTYNHDALLQSCHLFECKRVANRSQINHVDETGYGYNWTNWSADNGQAGLVEFDTFAVRKHSQASIDFQLCHRCGKSSLDLVFFVPGFIRLG